MIQFRGPANGFEAEGREWERQANQIETREAQQQRTRQINWAINKPNAFIFKLLTNRFSCMLYPEFTVSRVFKRYR